MNSRRLIILLLLCLVPFAGNGNGPDDIGRNTRSLDEIRRSGKLYVAFTSDDLNNINYELAKEFARFLKVELVEVEIEWEEAFMMGGAVPSGMETNPDLIYTPDALKRADIICSTFTILEWRKKLFGFARTLESAELLVIAKNGPPPKSFENIGGKTIAFQGETTFEQNLLQINSGLKDPMVLLRTQNTEDTKELLRKNKVYGIVLDADEALRFLASEDGFELALPVSEISRTAWATDKSNPPLIREVENFFETIESNGVLNEIFQEQFKRSYTSYRERLRNSQILKKCHRSLDEILESGKLVVALRERNFVYKEGGQKQFMHALAEEFADHLGVSLEIRITPEFSKYWVDDQDVLTRDSSYTPEWFSYFDLACETFAPLEWRTNKVNMVPVYPSAYTVIAHRDLEINSLEDLKNLRGVTGSSTVYEDMLRANGLNNLYYANINQFIPDVLSGKADYTVLYNAFSELSNYPELEGKLDLGELNISWGLRKDQSELQKEVERFMQESTRGGLVAVLLKALKGNTLQSTEAFISSYFESFQSGQLPNVNYGADDGLPQEDIFSIFQDQKGYLWFGTNSGAVRYNGREMRVYNKELGLPSNSIRDIDQDSSGTLFFASTNGIGLLTEKQDTSVLGEGASFNSVFVDSRSRAWFMSDEGLYLLSEDKKKLKEVNPGLPKRINHISEDPGSDQLLLSAREGAFIYNPATNTFRQIWPEECYSTYVDAGDLLWLATKDGLLIAGANTISDPSAPIDFVNLNKELGFPVSIIKDIRRSRFGSLWLISDSRIMQMISTDQKPIVYEQETGIKNNKILSFLIDQEDNIWIGFSGGLQRLTNSRGLRNFYPGTIDSYIYSSFQDKTGRIWITSDNGVFYFYRNGLVNFTRNLGTESEKFTGTVLPNDNILLVNNQGMTEISWRDLQVVRKKPFTRVSHSIENVFVSSLGDIFLMTGIHGVIYHFPGSSSRATELKNKYTSNIHELIEVDGKIIGGNNYGFIAFNGREFDTLTTTDLNIWSLYQTGDSTWVGTDGGIGSVKKGGFQNFQIHPLDKDLVVKAILPAKNRNYLWLGTNQGLAYYNTRSKTIDFTRDTKDGLSGDEITPGGLMLDDNGLLWVGTYHGISNFNLKAISNQNFAPVCYLEKLYLNGDVVSAVSGRSYSHKENNFVFEISALSFSDESSVEYEYYLRANRNQYTSYYRGREYRAHYNNLPAGKYEFVFKAKGKNNIWGYADTYSFTIRKAWYHTWVFRILLVLCVVGGIYLFYLIRMRSIRAQNEKLEQQVRERTRELESAYSEIEAQRDFAEQQHQRIAIQKKEIVSSIEYAQNIQNSLLPSREKLKTNLPPHFILFKPRDIVSGDFYWHSEQKNWDYLVAADCTGHGIPGAFMSMLGMALLNEIVNKEEDVEPAQMLNELRDQIMKTMHQTGDPGAAKDGMDMVVIRMNKKRSLLQFAGALNPLYHVRDGELTEYKGDKMPVSIHELMEPFTSKEIKLKKGDAIFLFSDGFADQFGGQAGKKFKYKPFKELLLSYVKKGEDFPGLEESINQVFEDWRGDLDQIDDVVLIGIKF